MRAQVTAKTLLIQFFVPNESLLASRSNLAWHSMVNYVLAATLRHCIPVPVKPFMNNVGKLRDATSTAESMSSLKEKKVDGTVTLKYKEYSLLNVNEYSPLQEKYWTILIVQLIENGSCQSVKSKTVVLIIIKSCIPTAFSVCQKHFWGMMYTLDSETSTSTFSF